ncbi:HD domain-containing protein [Mesobacillus maritimus]|uniref:HD domain-containing protein n=1 Tax=Mesobacillus maritimus TaxID=1643336 RepID=UPI00385151C1
MDVIEKAVQVATLAHDGQYRKNSKIPYISHPVAVGMILMKAGYPDELVAAGILHDTVEDTTLTLIEIKQWFGGNIAGIVEGCSEPDKSLSWEERKEHSIQFLKNAPEDIRIVSCADKLHNIRSILDRFVLEGEEVWSIFKRGREKQEWYYRSILDSLSHHSDFALLKELRTEIDNLFGLE